MFDKQATVAELRKRLADTAPPGFGSPRLRSADELTRADTRSTAELTASIPMLAPLDALLPSGGLPRGGIVSLQPDGNAAESGGSDAGLTTLLFTLLAGPSKPWSALVGFPDLGFAAAAELGVDLTRTVLIPQPGADVSQIVSVLVDGMDVIAVHAPNGPIGPPARQRVLASRLRQRGAVLVAVGPWPGADVSLTVSTLGWSGLGVGHGRLRDRELLVRLSGRRLGGAAPEVRMLFTAAPDRVLVQPGLGPEELPPGVAVQLVAGAVLDLGDGVTIRVTNP